MKLGELIKEIDPVAVTGATDQEILGIAYDSRQVKPGYIFVAINGRTRDGRLFSGEAVERGAVAVVSEPAGENGRQNNSGSGRKDPTTHVHVRDARQALGEIADAFYGRPSRGLKVIGITGTNGKTTISYMTRDILNEGGLKAGLIGTVEYEMGQRVIPATRTTPEAPDIQSMLAQMSNAGCKSAVMEVSSHSLIQKRTQGIEYDVAVFTNLTRDHLDYHETFEKYFEAKSLLFRSLGKLKKNAVAVINADDPWGRRLMKTDELAGKTLAYGMNTEAAVRTGEMKVSSSGSCFRVFTPWGEDEIEIRLLGRFNISNALAAIASCGALGMGLGTMKKALSRMESVPGRLEEIKNRRGFQVFVDYAHTDDALEHVLTTLREITRGHLVVVFGCGGNRDRTKRPIMGRVASQLADYSILTSDNPRKENPSEIIEEIQKGFGDAENYEIIEDRKEAISYAIEIADKGDVILITGKGHENFQEFANTAIPFDDRQVAGKILNG